MQISEITVNFQFNFFMYYGIFYSELCRANACFINE